MKIWHAVFLVAGAGIAGGLALRLAEPPPLPPVPAAPAPVVSAPASVPAPTVPGAPAPWKPAPPPEAVSSAPPPVYTEPPAPPQPARRKPKPFPEPVPVARAATPAAKPFPYQEPPKPSRYVTLEPGMSIAVRVNESVLAEPVVAGGLEVAERGAKVRIRTEDGNRLRLMSFQSADGQSVQISTEPVAVGETKDVNVIRFSLVKRITITERRL